MTDHAHAADAIAGLVTDFRRIGDGLGVTQILVAHVYGVSLDALLAATRKGRRAAEARQVAMYLAHVALRMNLAAVARNFGRDRATARHACRRVEEMREDPERDRLLARLEMLLRDSAQAGAGQ
jgi:chromosomal replication initiation ATPase DnaA